MRNDITECSNKLRAYVYYRNYESEKGNRHCLPLPGNRMHLPPAVPPPPMAPHLTGADNVSPYLQYSAAAAARPVIEATVSWRPGGRSPLRRRLAGRR